MDRLQLQKIIREAESKLRQAGIESAATEVEIILEYLLEVERIDIYLHGELLINEDILNQFGKIIEKRTTRYPLQYILGETYFYGRRFEVDRDVMVPTPETEILCELAINYLKNEEVESPHILDMGVGSGVIAVTIACECPDSWITAADISRAALAVARKNAALHGVESRIEFRKSDLFTSLRPNEKFDLILSNPPYIAESEYESLQPEVLDDPKISLVSGTDGLDVIRQLINMAPDYLKEGGRLMFEIGLNQEKKIADISEQNKRYCSYALMKDLNDINRVVVLSI